MRKKIFYYCIAILLITGACNLKGTEPEKMPKEKGNPQKAYTCPMDKGISSDKPGMCSKCGMALTKSNDKSKKH
jgi:hypothetical protein